MSTHLDSSGSKITTQSVKISTRVAPANRWKATVRRGPVCHVSRPYMVPETQSRSHKVAKDGGNVGGKSAILFLKLSTILLYYFMTIYIVHL